MTAKQEEKAFTDFWSVQTPFTAISTIESLKLWIGSNPWFSHCDTSTWFDVDTQQLDKLQLEYQAQWFKLCSKLMTREAFTFDDARFKAKEWSDPMYGAVAALYLMNCTFLQETVKLLKIDDPKAQRRLDYLLEQTLAAAAPSNFLFTNPEAIDKMVQTQGASLFSGMLHWMDDVKAGVLRQSDKDDFQVGVDLAVTPGTVIFQNEMLQLIQYAPSTDTQYKIPLLVVPPCINKYYIMDLRPKNSLIKYMVEQGHQVFLISWRNMDISMAETSWDDYLQKGVIAAMSVVRSISGVHDINTLGFCVGGTLLTQALAVLAARGDTPPNSLTLLTSFLDFMDTGPIDVYVDEQTVNYHEVTVGGKAGHYGIFRGEDMANTFSILRPNELWWNYNVDKYLKGEKPRAFDILFWNNDSSNLPGKMYSYYLRHGYLQNDFKSGEMQMCGVTMDYHNVTAPAYIYASRKDHIVPWESAYASTAILPGQKRFVLGASGHIAGVINPPADNKRSYWTNDKLVKKAQDWINKATEHTGSWWPDWAQWQAQYGGEKIPAVTKAGSPAFPPIEPAPGSYVMRSAT
ncbi:Poly(3-hydroxyalkanoate) polymerase subunit PhaC [Saezia sanguinis]|uniref:Poly(3-hydroxyalkanoate) polymerase subunit PhaC n=1 Tax=Saezia sanguinis TaxID=1965230 RepID=A0A433SIA2_9BURK|nr:class I poly(R)-hydroxyalkanoic acid synthase [Saezia sanguinis]RUS68344.1 Poly(3-hydroxyalkanoate) polymerase subunit PhaC [Saezia sanguinis]